MSKLWSGQGDALYGCVTGVGREMLSGCVTGGQGDALCGCVPRNKVRHSGPNSGLVR